MSKKPVAKSISLAKVVEPKFLTLTGHPANQVAFRIVRDDKEKEMTQETQSAKRRVRALRADTPLLAISFADGTTEDDARAIVEEYGLEGFSVTEKDGLVVAFRSGVDAIPQDAISVTLQGGAKAYIQKRSDGAAPEMSGLAVVALRFSKEAFPDSMDIQAWLQKQDVDFLENSTQNLDTETVVLRSEMPEGTETRLLEVETGVTLVVSRADVQDVPENLVAVVSEAAYGNWGWGQLDFAAALADIEFSEASRHALNLMEDVLRNIMFYSPLPVSVKKDLVNRATGQFAAYIGSLLDALPTQVVVATRSAIQSKETDMTKETAAPAGKTEEAMRSDASASATESTPVETSPAENITRAEIQEMINTAVTAAVAAARAEPATEPAPVVEGAAGSESGVEKVMEVMRSSFEELKGSLTSMTERLGKVESTVVLRTDAGDGKQGKPADPFRGVFGGAGK